MTDQKSGQKPPTLESELAAVRARLDQISQGRRSDFETTLLKGLRPLLSKDGLTSFVHEDNPTLTATEAEILIGFFQQLDEQFNLALKMRDLYNDMRGVIDVMRARLPVMPDPRFEEGVTHRKYLPRELNKLKP